MSYGCSALAASSDTCDLLCLDLPKAEAARKQLPAQALLDNAAASARALGDPTRLAIALALRETGEACVCDLSWICGRDEKLVSHHARVLRGAGIAASARRGKMVMYSLTARGEALLDAVSAEVAV
jgi:ArsR family transcriptional regulator, lead/cadmium/zinc/bismuth-responsive transcriptional repressor